MTADSLVQDLCRKIENQLGLMTPRAAVVTDLCTQLDAQLAAADAGTVTETLVRLATPLRTVRGDVAEALFGWLDHHLESTAQPEPLVTALLAAREPSLQMRALAAAVRRWQDQEQPPPAEVGESLAATIVGRFKEQEPAADDRAAINDTARLLGAHSPDADAASDPREALLCSGATLTRRRLAALALDTEGTPVPEARLVRVLGRDAAERLGGLMQYTRASHRDLVDLTPEGGPLPDRLVDQLADALQALGPTALGAVIGQFGWRSVSRSIAVEQFHGVSVDGSFPFLVTPAEAELLEACGTTRRLWDRRLVIAHGGVAGAAADDDQATGEVGRFRRYNLLHAELLGEIMEIAPVTPAKVNRIVRSLDEVVEHYEALFADHLEQPGEVSRRYEALKTPLLERIAGTADDVPLDAEVTRLVQMFEDPRSADKVTTLHGLKRFLHQHGLRLAFKRFRSGSAANRTVDLAVVSGDRVVQTLRKIRYIDFECGQMDGSLPFVVSLAVEALGRRLLHLQDDAPDLELLIYGNEVQTYVRFRNHPAFLRIDASPPLRGGMIDLEYFGVSQYELDHHPDLRLPWIQRVFRRLDFDANLDGLRLHIRYDKERAFDFADLVEHVRLLCCLLPHLMDLDWFLGGLRYPEPVKSLVADHCADWIVQWGQLPLGDMLTSDRRALLQEVRRDATGTTVVPWDGHGPVRHHLLGGPDTQFWPRLHDRLDYLEQAPTVCWAAAAEAAPAQQTLQGHVLDPLREAQALSAPSLDLNDEAPLHFAALLEAGGDELVQAACLAAVVGTVERHLRFETVGTIHGYPVSRARLMLPGEMLDISVLEDGAGVLRLAAVRARPFFLNPGTTGHGKVATISELDADALAARLRRGNYVGLAAELPTAPDGVDVTTLQAAFAAENPQAPPPAFPGDRTLDGVAAAPGRVSGRALFYRPDLTPADVEAAVLFAPALRPEDTPLLRRAAAVVSTGGGILSHAGMIAQELGKPALVVQGHWQLEDAGRATLVCRTTDHTEETHDHGPYPVTVYRNCRQREEVLCEGDLVSVNADRGKLGILGQDRDALAMQQELRHHDAVAEALETARPGPEELNLRGRLLRTAHQLEKLVSRMEQPNQARYAARELLAPRRVGEGTPSRSRRAHLLRRLFANPRAGAAALEAAIREEAGLAQRLHGQCAQSSRAVDAAETVHEVLFLQQNVRRTALALQVMRDGLRDAGALADAAPPVDCAALDDQCRRRLRQLRDRAVEELQAHADHEVQWWQARSQLAVLEAAAEALAEPVAAAVEPALRTRLAQAAQTHEQRALARLNGRVIVRPDDGGHELARLIGAKGAGLGEIARILGADAVPPWFAVSNDGFRQALAADIGLVDGSLRLPRGTPVILAIRKLMDRADLDTPALAAAVAEVWRSVDLPEPLADEIRQAYHALAQPDDDGNPSVAVRSSTFEEDSARSSWAGQFDTFLCIRGADAVLEHIKRSWASLWSERVLHHRRGLGLSSDLEDLGGGVLVQRLVSSRAAGVAHTLSTVSGQPRELVLNVGLGLGEGVVSGTVEVDQVAIARGAGAMPEQLDFRYTVGDKRHQVVFDRRLGRGTCIEETLYHQRLRPALEYTDLQDLVRAASRLESAMGYPLDVEFALAGDRLSILQARPIVAFQDALKQAREGRRPTREEPA